MTLFGRPSHPVPKSLLASALGRRAMRALLPMAVAMAACACSFLSSGKPVGRVMIVDGRGAPLVGATLLPDLEAPPNTPWHYTSTELAAHTSDEQGMILADLAEYFWDSDGCYHFLVHRPGYENVTMTVSRDLFPPVLKIEMKDRLQPSP
jgi:hypothetical protein